MGILASLVAAALILNVSLEGREASYTGLPEIVLSNVRLIDCDEGSGTGWIIQKNILVTAAHVSDGTNCVDNATGKKLREYKKDPTLDLALMTGDLPDYGGYIEYSCEGFRPGQEYEVYGWSSVGYSDSILRKNIVRATNKISTPDMIYRDGTSQLPSRKMDGYTVPGTSGGPYTRNGIAYGLVQSGIGIDTIFGRAYFPEVYATDLKDSILCH